MSRVDGRQAHGRGSGARPLPLPRVCRGPEGRLPLARWSLEFSAKLVCVGAVQHTRASFGARLEGRGYGHLCADTTNGKRGWALAWKEKVDEAAGYYSYQGPLRTLENESLVWTGTFS